MDLVLNAADYYFFTPYVYPATWPEDEPFRQIISLLLMTNLGALVLYFLFATLSYYFIFDHDLKKHPHFLENQVQREIKTTVQSLPWISLPTVALFFAEVRGYSKLYGNIEDSPYGWSGVILSMFSFIFFTDMCIYWIHRFLHHKLIYKPDKGILILKACRKGQFSCHSPVGLITGWSGVILSMFSFIFFTDMCIYWIHRFLHHKLIYKRIHKPHHLWKIATPFASHAFHPVDGFMQSIPYHIYPFLFPLHKVTYLVLYILVNVWSISIHDGAYLVPDCLKHVINGSAHHTDHHVYFDYNYGQYFTFWDKMGGSYKSPSSFEGKGPHDYIKKQKEEWSSRQNGHMDEKLLSGDSPKNE